MARYDDDHRGPAVQDAVPLNVCYMHLIELVDHTQPLRNVADREFEKLFDNIYPADQLGTAVLQHRKEAVARDTLMMAIRFGGLQVWVRPIGEGDTPVASSAILELTKDTFVTGVYIPINDTGWLRGRPLFIKEVDWASFVEDARKKAVGGALRPAAAGRPNARNEAIAIYRERLAKGQCLPRHKAEARAIWGILAERYKDDPTWTYKLASLEKALSDYRRAETSQ